MQSIYTAASGLANQQKRLDALASNVANINTTGFKATRVDFKDALYSSMEDPALVGTDENNLFIGSGVTLDATKLDFEQGAIVSTGMNLDFAIEGNGFFQLMDNNGEIFYTRSGSFKTAMINDENYLVNAQGHFVLDQTGNKITIQGSSEALKVSEKGVIQTEAGDGATLGIYQFANPNGLAPINDTGYASTEGSGEPQQDAESVLVQGSLENSNVDLASELTLLIRSQRAYSMASKALTTADEMMGLANNMR